MKVLRNLYHNILRQFSYQGKEKGGLIFLHGNEIVDFYVDSTGKCTYSSYKPDTDALSREIEQHQSAELTEIAFIHCHPEHIPLSNADVEWARSFIRLNKQYQVKLFLVQCDCILCYQITEWTCELLEICIM